MPHKTVFERFTDGKVSWLEPKQIWVEPTAEEKAAEEAHAAGLEARRIDLLAQTDRLIADMKAVGAPDVRS